MISKYLDDRPSDQEWLGNIPTHWDVRRLKFQINKVGSGVTPSGGAESYELEGIPLLRSQNVHFDGLRLDDVVFITPETHNSMANSKVQPKDVLLNITGASIGRCCVVPGQIGEANVNQHVAIIRSDSSIDPGFLAFLLRADPGQKQIELSQTGSGREGLTFEAIRNFVIPLPGIPEQRQIAAFLDWKTGQIDALMARKKELLEKLKEKRLAVITQAVTRGLNPAAPLRDSGIPWLGHVPTHWEVKKFSYFSRVVRGASPRPAGDPTYFNGDYIPWITVGEITKDELIYLESTETMLTEEGAQNSRILTAGTLVVSNSGATLGVPKILSITGCANDGVVAFEDLAEDVDKLFLYLFLRSQTEELRERMKQGGGQPNLNTDIIKALAVPFPTLQEQIQIAVHLRGATAKIDKLTAKVTEAIDRLTEYRTALITAATTGKIDVRGVKIPQPAA